MHILTKNDFLRRSLGSATSRLILAAFVVTLIAFASVSNADQITTVPGYGPWKTTGSGGGEFTVVADPSLAALVGNFGSYSSSTINQGGYRNSFQTFCIERNEYLQANTTYDVTLNNMTLYTGDPLSAGAAYLYQQFATGQLYYNYANTPTFDIYSGSSRNDGFLYSAYYLQNALWYLMDPVLFGGQANNPYVVQAQNALGGVAAAFAPDNGAHGVSVLNLWTPGQPHDPQHSWQDVLVLVPEPSTFAILAVGGLLALRRRKQNLLLQN